jgi:hypothetical protein
MNNFAANPETSADPHGRETHSADRAGVCAHCGGESRAEKEARQARMLKRLAEIVLACAENLEERSAAEASVAKTIAAQAATGVISAAEAGDLMTKSGKRADDIARSLTNVSKALRLTLLLDSKLAEERMAREQAAPLEAAKRRAALAEDRHHRQREEVRRVMAEAIRAEAGDQAELNRRKRELRERLEQDDIKLIIGKRSTEEIVARICRDLGIEPDWRRWHNEAWMIEPEFEAAPRPHCPACCPVCEPTARQADWPAQDHREAQAASAHAPVDRMVGTGPP